MLSVIVIVLVGCHPAASGPGVVAPTAVEAPQPSRPPQPIELGTLAGQLQADDGRDENGRFEDWYSIELRQGQRIRAWVRGVNIDTMLLVRGPGGFEASNDDFLPNSLDPIVEISAIGDGEHLVRVTSFAPGVQGAYQLGLTEIQPPESSDLDDGGSATGTLTPEGAGPGIAVGASMWLEAQGGERLRVRVTSTDFDTIAALIAPTGQVWVNDDAGDTGPDGSERPLDSTVTAMAPSSGMYQLVVVPYGAPGNGNFRVRTTRNPPVILAEGESVPSVGYAGREGQGRILGLFVGITDYQEGRSRLYGCADDATLLAQAFRERRLQSDAQQTVLTDLNANQAAFTAGLQQLASQSTENDVVVIFYSGHGGSVPRADSDQHDIDGTDETIVLVDGSLRDDEVVAMIDQITADVVILALDACHSGGFARDFLTRPGRIGLFSSGEDVLSDTAEPLLAGGYLSYTLRRAVIGEADAMPNDGALFAGELTDYMHSQFVEYNEHMNPPTSTSPRQWLNAHRGSIGWHDVLWLYPRGSDGALMPIPNVPLQSAPPQRSSSKSWKLIRAVP